MVPAGAVAALIAGSPDAGAGFRSGDVIATRNLRVTFKSPAGPVEALRGLDLAIPRGALFVLLGPNGAGKTTLMRCITGLVEPTGGSLALFGEGMEKGVSQARRARLARMGVLIENPGQYGRLDAREYLTFFGSFYPILDLKGRIQGLCAELGLELDRKPVAKLSQGNRQKLQLARSLLHRPELLLWDEPTDHLDPVSQRQVLAYLRGYLRESGATALVATHRLEQLEAVGTHFGFLSQGGLKGAGSREEILEGASGSPASPVSALARARIGFARAVRPDELAWLAADFAARLDFPPGEGHLVDIGAAGLRERMPELIKALVERNLPVASVEPYRATLAEVYQRLVGS
ncbi:MAG: ABC transporter ATP-binding protein [Fibrobacteria bacterium]